MISFVTLVFATTREVITNPVCRQTPFTSEKSGKAERNIQLLRVAWNRFLIVEHGVLLRTYQSVDVQQDWEASNGARWQLTYLAFNCWYFYSLCFESEHSSHQNTMMSSNFQSNKRKETELADTTGLPFVVVFIVNLERADFLSELWLAWDMYIKGKNYIFWEESFLFVWAITKYIWMLVTTIKTRRYAVFIVKKNHNSMNDAW
jgi:hypothetical protein